MRAVTDSGKIAELEFRVASVWALREAAKSAFPALGSVTVSLDKAHSRPLETDEQVADLFRHEAPSVFIK